MTEESIGSLKEMAMGMRKDEFVSLNYFRDSLEQGISVWKNSEDPSHTEMRISTYKNLGPDSWSIAVYDTGPGKYEQLYCHEMTVSPDEFLVGTFQNSFGRLMENFASDFAPSCSISTSRNRFLNLPFATSP
jgi:hypothetical protein